MVYGQWSVDCRVMKALILAAGYGTRLYPLTKKYPKALLPVAKRPLLNYIIGKLTKIKHIAEIIVVTNDKFFSNFSLWAKKFKSKKHNVRLEVLNDGTTAEKDRLGAIGDIHFVLCKENIKEDVLIIGGDNLFEEDISHFVKFALHKRPRVTVGVYDIRRRSSASKYGVVTLAAKDNKIIDFAEKPAHPQSSLIATCLYYIAKEKLRYFKEYLKDPRNEKDSAGSFISWLSKKEEVYGFVFRKHWYDIGDPKIYQEADRVFSQIKPRLMERMQ